MSRSTIAVGCTVRFLDAVGGGRVVRLTRDTAWVEDADGFEIPTPLSQCVLVESGDTFAPAYRPPRLQSSSPEPSGPSAPSGAVPSPTDPPRQASAEDYFPQDHPSTPQRDVPLPHTFVPASGSVNAYLAFVPIDIRQLGKTPYEVVLINDSKYSLYYVYSSRSGDQWQMHAHGLLYPEHDITLEELPVSQLNDRERLNIQLIALADNPGIYLDTYSLDLKPDPRRLLRLHTFADNALMDEKALLIDLVRDGKPHRPATPPPTSQQIYDGLAASTKQAHHTPAPKPQKKPRSAGEPLVIDLHIEQLLDSTAGMDGAAILEYQLGHFHNVMQAYLKQTGMKIIFIHGKGDGVLRSKLLSELKYRYKHCHWQDASFSEYSFGATQVTIGQLK